MLVAFILRPAFCACRFHLEAGVLCLSVSSRGRRFVLVVFILRPAFCTCRFIMSNEADSSLSIDFIFEHKFSKHCSYVVD